MTKFVWRGKTLEELRGMELKEFMGLLKSGERRSLRRGFTEDQKKLLESVRKRRDKFHRTKSRDMVIIPELVGLKLGVYNGKEYVSLEVGPEMLGKRLGEFVLTRKTVKHSAPGFGATKSSKFVPLK
jgi:small subunit ribosomal protein S19